MNSDFYKNASGYILAEWMIGLGILIMCLTLAINTITYINWGPTQLDRETQRVVRYIKKLQLISMTGYRNERAYPSSIDLYKHRMLCTYYLPNQQVMEVELPAPIICKSIGKPISFLVDGRPYGRSRLILEDTKTGDANQIIIAVQTGRIRWIPIIRKGRYINEQE